MAGSDAAKEAIYLSSFLGELGFGLDSPVCFAMDNKSAIDISYNPEHHERVKHIERRHFFIRELVENQTLVVPFVSTVANMADFLTKPLAASDFYRMRNVIMNIHDDEKCAPRRNAVRSTGG